MLESKGLNRRPALFHQRNLPRSRFDYLISRKIIKSSGARKKSLHEDRCGSGAASLGGNKPPTPFAQLPASRSWLAPSCACGARREGIDRLLDQRLYRRREAL